MTQQDLKDYIREANFELLDFIPTPNLDVLKYLDNSTLNVSKQLYPNLTLNDLVSSYVYFIIRKP